MSKSTNTKDEIAVWFDVNIGHSHCPDEETKENCKYTELTKLIDEQVLAGRIDELTKFTQVMNAIRVDDGFTPIEYTYIGKRLTNLTNTSNKPKETVEQYIDRKLDAGSPSVRDVMNAKLKEKY